MKQITCKKDIDKDFIREFCKETEARKAWYNTFIQTPIKHEKDGVVTEDKPTFIELQLAFIKEYFPEYAPKPKRAKKESIYDLL